tara:strand:- start:37468 stop:38820 length:1353 start_codon:yes stop_codon:yes gene_type:complete
MKKNDAIYDHQKKRELLYGQLKKIGSESIRLEKTTSNLFRSRDLKPQSLLDMKSFNKVLSVDQDSQLIEVEGMATYEQLINASLPKGLMPAVVPQLKSITVGGAISGIGIESSSFRYGLVHETISEMDVLLANDEIVTCTPYNEYRDLFFGLPNSYGTLGYILKLKAKGIPIKPYVKLTHISISNALEFFEKIEEVCKKDFDFVDGAVFDTNCHYITVGKFVDEAPYTSDYTFLDIYFKSIKNRREDYLSTHDYLWRWDTDWFWCSKNLFVQNLIMRCLLGRKRLNSITYQKIMRWNTKVGLTHTLNSWFGYHTESVIQDVDIPIHNAAKFLDFFHREIGVRPIWVCPIKHRLTENYFPLFQMDPEKLYINFGFWDVIRGRKKLPEGYYNRKIEKMVADLGGKKSLYSSSYYPEKEFWSHYNGLTYQQLKRRYDPDFRFKDLYRKSVLNH